MAKVKTEPPNEAETLGGDGEDIDRRVGHCAAGHALQMDVIFTGWREVVKRRTVPGVNVLNRTDFR